MNVASIVKKNAETTGDKIAIIYQTKQYSYAQVWSMIIYVAEILSSHGIKKGDRVGLSMKDRPLHLISHFAVAVIGAVIVPIDHRWTVSEKESASHTFKTKLILNEGGEIGNAKTIYLDEKSIPSKITLKSQIDLDCDQELLISLSSGTTGKPKGAILSHRNLYERFVSQWKSIGFGAEDCFGLLTPLFFGAGRSFAMSMLVVGGAIEISPPPHTPKEIIKILNSGNINATFLPPTLLRRLIPLAKFPQPILNKIKYLLYSGEPLHSKEALFCLEKICPNLIGYYASSEGGGISVINSSELKKYSSTVGAPIYQTEIEIVDENNQKKDVNNAGRIRYRGPGVATRFIDHDGKESSSNDTGGWFYPGDLAKELPTGHIQLIGRSDDVIIRGGVNIYPNEIESIMTEDPGINEVAIIGHKDSERGEVIIAFIETNQNFELSKTKIFCKENLAPYKIPEQIIDIGVLPKKESGKIDKHLLREKLIKS